jgi:hypothetical protein
MAAQPNNTDPPDIRDILAKLSGSAIAEFSCRWENGLTLTYQRPQSATGPTVDGPLPSASVLKKCEAIKAYLRSHVEPRQMKNIFKDLNGGSRGGDFSRALKYLRQTGQVFVKAWHYSDDRSKFSGVKFDGVPDDEMDDEDE